jgi:hypothetical protein
MAVTVATVDVGGTGASDAATALTNLGAAPIAAYAVANAAYAQANSAFPTMNIITGTSATAIVAQNYVITNTAQTSITLPASANSGDVIWVSCENGLSNNTILRNGNKIKSIAENMLIDVANVTVQLRYVNANVGWTIT